MMKKIKNICVAICVMIGMSLSAQINTGPGLEDGNGGTVSQQDLNTTANAGKSAMSKFVESYKTVYSSGDTYNQFKSKVLSEGRTSSGRLIGPTQVLSKEGNDLLYKTYDYLKRGYSSSQINNLDNGEVYMNAINFMMTKIDQGMSEEAAFAALYGENARSVKTTSSRTQSRGRRCRELGRRNKLWCHLGNAAEWLWNNRKAIKKFLDQF